MAILRFPSPQFRVLPAPVGSARVGLFYVPVGMMPDELWEWREVNPREVNRRSAVYGAMTWTLMNDAPRFHERNRGITIVAADLSYDDKTKQVVIRLDDTKQHGVVDGAHSLDASLESKRQGIGSDWPAYMFVKVIVGVDPDQIAEIAGGLNTSQQVDLKSLENLRNHFTLLQNVLKDEKYGDQIAYKMNEAKPVDVREILYYLAVFDSTEYSESRHPVALFGRKEGIVRRFADQAAQIESAGDSFKILITKAPDILRLRDLIEKKALEQDIGRYKVGKNTRVRSESNKESSLIFIDEKVNGKIPLGWIMPMLAGFRANVDWNKPKGTFSWLVDLDELLDKCIEQLVLGIRDVHEQENSRPEYVGRNSIAWRMSYNTVSQAILQWQLARVQHRPRSFK